MAKKHSENWGVASLLFGIIGLLPIFGFSLLLVSNIPKFGYVAYIVALLFVILIRIQIAAFLLPIIAIVCYFVQKRVGYSKLARIGLILGSLELVVAIGYSIFVLFIFLH